MSEHGGARESFSVESKNLVKKLSRSARNVSDIAAAVKNSYTDLPTSEVAVGVFESRALIEVREQMTEKLVVYGGLHLPLSIAVANDLVRTLDYFENDYDQFKLVLRFVQMQVKEAEERAKFVEDMYLDLARDLTKLGEDADKAVKVARVAALDNLANAKWKAYFAKAFGIGAVGSVSGGVTVGVCLALSLLGPGGLLFAPSLAIPALVASTAVGCAAASGTGAAATVLKGQSNRSQRVADMLKESDIVYETVLVGALREFAGCMTVFANFFQSMSDKLDNLDRNIEYLDNASEDSSGDELRALYVSIRSESDNLRKACTLYVSHTTQTKVDIGLLGLFKDEKYKSYIDEWYEKCPSEKKGMKSTKSLIKKALPQREALH